MASYLSWEIYDAETGEVLTTLCGFPTSQVEAELEEWLETHAADMREVRE